MEQVLALAAAAEVGSEHPLATAIMSHAEAVLCTASRHRPAEATTGRDLSWVWPSESLEALPGRCTTHESSLPDIYIETKTV
jgi:cation transport ATPase